MNYRKKLIINVTELSENQDWDIAKTEWIVDGYNDEIDENDKTCICGKKGLKTLYEISNSVNRNHICNIGSDCMKHFQFNDYESNKIKILSMKNNILKVKDAKYNGYKYCEIVKNKGYMEFLKKNASKTGFNALIAYYECIQSIKNDRVLSS
jgi:hypothetical protein